MEYAPLIIFVVELVVGLIVAGFIFYGILKFVRHRIEANLKLREIEDEFAQKRLNTKLHAKHMDYVDAIGKRHGGDKPLLGEAIIDDID